MNTLLTEILYTVQSIHIPSLDSKSRPVFNELVYGVKRKYLASLNESYRGSPLENIENDKFGNWLVDRYEDADGDSCLKFNYRHLCGDQKLDEEARKIRRKQRAEYSLKLAKQGRRRVPKAEKHLSTVLTAYFLLLGDAANDPDLESKKPSKD